jgi:voltage-gated potassium channel
LANVSILTRQEKNVPSGRKSYIAGGKRTISGYTTEKRPACVLDGTARMAMRESMGLAARVGAATVLVSLTLCLQCAGMSVLIHWARTFIERLTKRLSPWRAAVLMVQFAAAMIVLQISETMAWACFYRWECFSAWETSFYFSAASYSTVGYGDVLLPQMWRALGPVESLTGMLMCGMSVSGLFAVLTRILAAEAKSSVATAERA